MSSIKNPTSKENLQVETVGTTVVENQIKEEDFNGMRIIHEGFSKDDYRQKIVQRAYEVGGMDLVILIECEDGNWNPFAVGDNGKAHGLCQMNTNYHKIPQEYYDDWGFQVEYCKDKLRGGTKFYGPNRIIKGMKCSEFVLDRFTFIE